MVLARRGRWLAALRPLRCSRRCDSAAGIAADTPADAASTDQVMKVMSAELKRATSDLASPTRSLLHQLHSLRTEFHRAGRRLRFPADQHRRSSPQADVTMRIGSPALDNTHGQSRASGMICGSEE